MHDICKKIKDFCSSHKYVFIYGAGAFSSVVLDAVQREGIDISGIVISKYEKKEFLGHPVSRVQDIEYDPGLCGFVLGLSSKYHDEVEGLLHSFGFENVLKFPDEVLRSTWRELNELNDKVLSVYNKFLTPKMEKNTNWRRILVLRLDGIGDVVLATPFLRELRRNHPSSYIALIVGRNTYDYVKHCPYVDHVVAYHWESIVSYPLHVRMDSAKSFMEKEFAGSAFTAAILPRFDVDYYDASLLAFFSGAPYRLTYSEKVRPQKQIKNKNYDRLFSHVLMADGIKHELFRNLDVLHEMGDMVASSRLELWETAEDTNAVSAKLMNLNQTMHLNKMLAVGIGGSSQFKKWKTENYIALIKGIHVWNPELAFVLLGGKSEVKDAEEILKKVGKANILDFTNQLSLGEVTSLLRRVLLYVGNDTGVKHIATACGCRVIEICYGGSICAERFGPAEGIYKIHQSNIGKRSADDEYIGSIDHIRVRDVIDSVKEMLSERDCV